MSDDETQRAKERPEGPEDEAAPAITSDADAALTSEVAPDAPAERDLGASAGLRMLGAAVTLPWLVLYGVTGASAVTRGAQAYSSGLERVDAGYTRFVSPGELVFFGALLLTAFAVLMACALLLLFRHRTALGWLLEFIVAAGLTAGAVWAGVVGELHPLLWILLFFGLVYVTVVALARLVQVTRAAPRGRIDPR
jgi:hypothetical protein